MQNRKWNRIIILKRTVDAYCSRVFWWKADKHMTRQSLVWRNTFSFIFAENVTSLDAIGGPNYLWAWEMRKDHTLIKISSKVQGYTNSYVDEMMCNKLPYWIIHVSKQQWPTWTTTVALIPLHACAVACLAPTVEISRTFASELPV